MYQAVDVAGGSERLMQQLLWACIQLVLNFSLPLTAGANHQRPICCQAQPGRSQFDDLPFQVLCLEKAVSCQ